MRSIIFEKVNAFISDAKEKMNQDIEDKRQQLENKREEKRQELESKQKELDEKRKEKSKIIGNKIKVYRLRKQAEVDFGVSSKLYIAADEEAKDALKAEKEASRELNFLNEEYKSLSKEYDILTSDDNTYSKELADAIERLSQFEDTYNTIDFESENGVYNIETIIGRQEEKETVRMSDGQVYKNEEPIDDMEEIMEMQEQQILKEELDQRFAEIEEGYEDILPQSYFNFKQLVKKQNDIEGVLKALEGKTLLDILEGQIVHFEPNSLSKKEMDNIIEQVKERKKELELQRQNSQGQNSQGKNGQGQNSQGTKQEGTKQGGTKQEGTKQEGTKQEGTKQEETKQEGTKQEETKQEETKQEERLMQYAEELLILDQEYSLAKIDKETRVSEFKRINDKYTDIDILVRNKYIDCVDLLSEIEDKIADAHEQDEIDVLEMEKENLLHQYKDVSTAAIYTVNKLKEFSKLQENNDKELSKENEKINNISIGKEIIITYNDKDSIPTILDFKNVKRNLAITKEEKIANIEAIMGTTVSWEKREDLLNKIDPNFVYALLVAKEEGVQLDEIRQIFNAYGWSLKGEKEAQEETKKILTYDRRGLDFIRPKNILNMLLRRKEYRQIKEFALEAESEGRSEVELDVPGFIRKMLYSKQRPRIGNRKISTEIDDIKTNINKKVNKRSNGIKVKKDEYVKFEVKPTEIDILKDVRVDDAIKERINKVTEEFNKDFGTSLPKSKEEKEEEL